MSETGWVNVAAMQQPRAADEGVLRRILHGLSCREYRACAEAVPEAFGLSASTMSRRYIRASARKLQALQERRLEQLVGEHASGEIAIRLAALPDEANGVLLIIGSR